MDLEADVDYLPAPDPVQDDAILIARGDLRKAMASLGYSQTEIRAVLERIEPIE